MIYRVGWRDCFRMLVSEFESCWVWSLLPSINESKDILYLFKRQKEWKWRPLQTSYSAQHGEAFTKQSSKPQKAIMMPLISIIYCQCQSVRPLVKARSEYQCKFKKMPRPRASRNIETQPRSLACKFASLGVSNVLVLLGIMRRTFFVCQWG